MPQSRAAAALQPPAEDVEQPVTVLVTGFGPFLDRIPNNSSWDIASRLPALIPATPTCPTPIHIHVHHQPIRVAYKSVVDLVPTLHEPATTHQPKPDITLHIGLAAGRTFYTLEKGSHGTGYGAIRDVDGDRFPDDKALEKFPRELFPPVLHTGFSVEDVVARWRANLEEKIGHDTGSIPDVRPSPDAGNYMCGFIYYNSLAHYYNMKKDDRPVAFMHVPHLGDNDEKKLAVGKEVAISLIKALVQSRRDFGATNKLAEEKDISSVAAGTDVNFV